MAAVLQDRPATPQSAPQEIPNAALRDYKMAPKLFDENIKEMFRVCAEAGVSDIYIKTDNNVKVKLHSGYYEIGGRRIAAAEAESVLAFVFQGPNGMVMINSGTPIDGSFDIGDASARLRFRYCATGCFERGRVGLEIVVRTIESMPKPIDGMGIPAAIIQNFIPDDGLVMVTGPTGSGKTTLLAGMIRHTLEDETRSLRFLTYEDPIEFTYDKVVKNRSHITQTEVSRAIDGGYPNCGRNAVRRAPNVIFYGESRDRATMDAALEGANTGHAVLTTLHSQGVPESIKRISDLYPGGDKGLKMQEAVDCLRMIVTQFLVPTADGKGRVPVREYLVFDAPLRDKLSLIDDPTRLVNAVRAEVRSRDQSMLSCARGLFAEGRISQQILNRFIRREQELEQVEKHSAGGVYVA